MASGHCFPERFLIGKTRKLCRGCPIGWLFRGKQWRQYLDSQLAAAGTDAGRKANWLIARALAESLVLEKARLQFLRGRPWLEELLDTAPSSALRIHAIEKLARGYTDADKYDECAQFLDSTAAQYPDGETIAVIESLRAKLMRDQVEYLTMKTAEMRRRAAYKDEQAEGTEDESRRQIYVKWANYFRQEEQKFLARREQIEQ